jgi:uncharacterized membrane protein YedE/YeeE
MSRLGLIRSARFALVGLLLGYVLTRIGFADFGQVHDMFVFADLRMFLTFCGSVALAAAGFAVFGRKDKPRRRPIHKGTIPGGVLFGVGWAITGACPSIALAQVGGGQLPAVITIVGIVAGNLLYGAVHKRYFRWDPGSCET